MSDFKTGGVPIPDYDQDEVNFFNGKTEFTDDIFIYGDTYSQSFNNVEISVVGSTLTFTVAGIGSTSLTLSWLILSVYFLIRRSGGN